MGNEQSKKALTNTQNPSSFVTSILARENETQNTQKDILKPAIKTTNLTNESQISTIVKHNLFDSSIQSSRSQKSVLVTSAL